MFARTEKKRKREREKPAPGKSQSQGSAKKADGLWIKYSHFYLSFSSLNFLLPVFLFPFLLFLLPLLKRDDRTHITRKTDLNNLSYTKITPKLNRWPIEVRGQAVVDLIWVRTRVFSNRQGKHKWIAKYTSSKRTHTVTWAKSERNRDRHKAKERGRERWWWWGREEDKNSCANSIWHIIYHVTCVSRKFNFLLGQFTCHYLQVTCVPAAQNTHTQVKEGQSAAKW